MLRRGEAEHPSERKETVTTTAKTYLASLQMDEGLGKLHDLLAEIFNDDEAEAEAKARIVAVREQLAIREAELLMEGVEGKNETERKAALRVKQDKDEISRLIVDNLHRAESDLSAAQVRGGNLRREWQYYRLVVEVGMAKLAFLGSTAGSGLRDLPEQPKATNGKELFG